MEVKMNQPKTLFFLFLIFIYVTPVNSGTQIQVTTSESFTFSRINAADVRNYIYFQSPVMLIICRMILLSNMKKRLKTTVKKSESFEKSTDSFE